MDLLTSPRENVGPDAPINILFSVRNVKPNGVIGRRIVNEAELVQVMQRNLTDARGRNLLKMNRINIKQIDLGTLSFVD